LVTSDGPGDALGSVVSIRVGVGTGGRVSAGAAEPDKDADGAAEGGVTLGVARGTTRSTIATAFVEDLADNAGAGPVAEVAAGPGAEPRPPAPLGDAVTNAGGWPGEPRAQPPETANGSPSATMPRKTDFGVSRTS
jgi:hypothetical protein